MTVVGAGVVGAAIARELARHPPAHRPRRRGRRHRQRHVEGQHRDPAHRLRRRARLAGGPPRPRGPGSPRRVRRRVRHPRRTASAPSSSPGTRSSSPRCPACATKAERNGYHDARIIDADELRAREPHLGPGALGALARPRREHHLPLDHHARLRHPGRPRGRATCTSTAGCGTSPADADGTHLLTTSRGPLRTRYLVNAAGLYADEIDRLLGHDVFTVTPRRGQLIVFDKLARDLVRHILLPVPGPSGKGVLVAPTVYGNVLLGPTAEELDDKTRHRLHRRRPAELREKGRRILPALLDEEVTAVYAGLRAATETGRLPHPGVPRTALRRRRRHPLHRPHRVHGHRRARHRPARRHRPGRPGGATRDSRPVTHAQPRRGVPPPLPERRHSIAERPGVRHARLPLRTVTLGEIRDALAATVPPRSLDGLRRRTRARGGRCQGFYCGAAVRALFEEARAVDPDDATRGRRPGRRRGPRGPRRRRRARRGRRRPGGGPGTRAGGGRQSPATATTADSAGASTRSLYAWTSATRSPYARKGRTGPPTPGGAWRPPWTRGPRAHRGHRHRLGGPLTVETTGPARTRTDHRAGRGPRHRRP